MIYNMKTIAITMDEDLLRRVDLISFRLRSKGGNRSGIVRQAVSEYLSRVEGEAEEEREKAIFKKHRGRLAKQTTALVKEQAKP